MGTDQTVTKFWNIVMLFIVKSIFGDFSYVWHKGWWARAKNSIFIFHCFFDFFGMRGVHHTKIMFNSMFFALKFGTFWAFFQCVSPCHVSVSVLKSFEILQHLTLPTKWYQNLCHIFHWFANVLVRINHINNEVIFWRQPFPKWLYSIWN